MSRKYWVLVHRYAGLYLAFFLVIAGMTGCLMAFYGELDKWLNPQFFIVNPEAKPLDIDQLIERVEQIEPRAKVNYVANFPHKPDESLNLYIEPRIDPVLGQPYELEFDELFLNPYNGKALGRRAWGKVSLTRENLMPFIYRLHYELALPNNIGKWLFGIAAIIWTLDCFVGFYLTFPRGRPFWKKWLPSWKVKTSASATRINFDLHRAGGLWTWVMLLVFAWSAVYLNLGEEVYLPTMKTVFEIKNPHTADLPIVAKPQETPAIGWRAAILIGRELMAKQANALGFAIEHEEFLIYDSQHDVYHYGVKSSRDIGKHGMTSLFFSAESGAFKALILPTAQYTGNTITTWLINLHMAQVFGLPMQIFVCFMGALVAVLSITGVLIWRQKQFSTRDGGGNS